MQTDAKVFISNVHLVKKGSKQNDYNYKSINL